MVESDKEIAPKLCTALRYDSQRAEEQLKVSLQHFRRSNTWTPAEEKHEIEPQDEIFLRHSQSDSWRNKVKRVLCRLSCRKCLLRCLGLHNTSLMRGEPLNEQEKNQLQMVLSSILQSSWLLLVILGICASIVAWMIDESVALIAYLHQHFTLLGGESWLAKYMLYVLFRILTLLLGVAITHYISPNSVGSGIPEMRSILGGFSLPTYLMKQALVAKSLGLVCALGSGLSIGKEGPFVHLSCIIANQLLNCKLFRQIHRSPDLTHHVLSAACAVGVTATFGAPIGGVLFSIEVTTTYYMTSNYWRAFFCSVVGVVVFRWLNRFSVLNNPVSLFTTEFDVLPYQVYEIILFLILAAICGVLAGVFVKVFSKVVRWRRKYQNRFNDYKPFRYAILVALVFGIIEYPVGSIMTLSNTEAIDDLFVATNITDMQNTHLERKYNTSWSSPSLVINLVCFGIVRFVATVVAASVAIPCGIVTPIFAIGASFGRLFGEIVSFMGGGSQIPGGYAIVGAAAFTAGVTGTVSIAVIVFELTNQLSYMIPVLLSVLIGRAMALWISKDIYDMIGTDLKLPQRPNISKQESYSLVAADLMRPIPVYAMSRWQTLRSVRKMLLTYPAVSLFPVVDHTESMVYLGVAARYELEALVDIWQICTKPKETRKGLDVPMSPTSRLVLVESEQAISALTSEQSRALRREESIESESIDLAALGLLALDFANFHVTRDTFSSQTILLMSVHKTSQLFVTGRGKLIGVVEAADLTSL